MAAVQGLNVANDPVMDTRTPSPVHRNESEDSSSNDPDYKPDLSAEVAMLSTKLVNAINYQTNLDDSLQHSRHELDHARQKIAELEKEKQRLSSIVNDGMYVKKSDMETTLAKMRNEVASARAAKETAEKAKKQTDGELENLTVSLFEEANKMVAAARKNTEATEKRNAQLTAQLRDTELLLASQQEQLQDLKGTMEKLQDEAPPTREHSVPSTPITANAAMFDSLPITASALLDMTPEHPLFFSHLLSPVLRKDTAAFTDFQEILLLARRLGAHSRSNSSNGTNSSNNVSSAASMSSPSIPGAFSLSADRSPSSIYGGSSTVSSMPALKDSKFYKRALTEDIEPTLRLDLAPGLSFLSRRTVLSSLLQGTLVVEPYPQNKHYFACTLCGENRRKEDYIRRHRFRMSEDDGVSKPLCDYCVSRLRSTCDFVSFLRMVRDGLWRCDSDHDQQMAWEESVRLRERMFWARLGGGVVPRLQQSPYKNPSLNGSNLAAEGVAERDSLENIPEGKPMNAKPSTGSTLPTVTVRMPSSTARPLSHVTPPGSATESSSDEPSTHTDKPVGGGGDNITPQFEDASEQFDRELEIAAAAEEIGAKDVTHVPSDQRQSEDRPSRPRSRAEEADEKPSSRIPSPSKHDPNDTTSPTLSSSSTTTKRASVLSVTPAAERNASIDNNTTSSRSSPRKSSSRSPSKRPQQPDNELDAERNRWSKSKRASSVQSVTTGATEGRNGSVISVDENEGSGVEGLGVSFPPKMERKGSSVLERVRAMEGQ